MLCSTRDTKIARVEGLWLVNRHKCSVSEYPDDSPEVQVCSPFIVPSLNSTRDPWDVILWCHDCLHWSSSRKTTVHAHRKHRHLSAHLPVSMPESLNTINASKPLHLFLSPNSVPVTIMWQASIYMAKLFKFNHFSLISHCDRLCVWALGSGIKLSYLFKTNFVFYLILTRITKKDNHQQAKEIFKLHLQSI